jgi:hypothetical protein
MLKMLLLLSS